MRLLRGLDARLECFAERAPCCPELDEHRLLPDDTREIERAAVQVLELHGLGYVADRQTDVLTMQRRTCRQPEHRGKQDGKSRQKAAGRPYICHCVRDPVHDPLRDTIDIPLIPLVTLTPVDLT